MQQIKLNPHFIQNIVVTYGEEGKNWLNHLTHHIDTLASQWNFELLSPVQELSFNFVALVKWQSQFAILKMAPPAAHLLREAQWLKDHKKRVPAVLQIDEANNAFLMEKLEPGITLKQWVKEGKDEEATQIIAEVISELQSSTPLPKTNYQHLAEHAGYFAFLHGHLRETIIDTAESLFKDLCFDRTDDIVLHGDLHHDNILQHHTSWTVIDPHGYIGDACAEVGCMIFNPIDCFPSHISMQRIIETRLNILAEILPFDLERIKAWAFCLSLRSAAWDIEGFAKPNQQTLEIAQILYDGLHKRKIKS